MKHKKKHAKGGIKLDNPWKAITIALVAVFVLTIIVKMIV